MTNIYNILQKGKTHFNMGNPVVDVRTLVVLVSREAIVDRYLSTSRCHNKEKSTQKKYAKQC